MRWLPESIINSLISLYFIIIRQLLWKPFVKKLNQPFYEQNKVLKRIIHRNKDTVIGKKYNFLNINTYEDYIKAVPVHYFEMLRDDIDNQLKTGNQCLSKDRPIMYTSTSGTTDKPKLIPVLPETVSNYRRSQTVSLYSEYMECPSMFDGKILAISSCGSEGKLDNGITFGSVSGLVYKNIPKFIKHKYVIPYEVFEIKDYNEKYFLMCALAILQPNITTVAAVNPTTILKLSEIINDRFDDLLIILEKGSYDHLIDITEHGKTILKKYIKNNIKRAAELKYIKRTSKKMRIKDIWPGLKAVVTWTQGNCSVSIPRLRSHLDQNTKIFELGYFSSEFRGTIILNPKGVSGVPVIDENFYEFAERDDWDSGNRSFRTLESIETGKQYYIIVTTPYGLYRYFINDIVEVTGKHNNTPEIRFLQKGKGVTSLSGEKLYESHIISALHNISNKLGLDLSFFAIIAKPAELVYRIYIESEPGNGTQLANLIDEGLKDINIEYKSKRDSGRLCKPELEFLKSGTGELYKQHCIRNGRRDSQFKFNHLMYESECSFDFNQFIIN